MSGYSLSAVRTNSWPSGRIPDIEKLHCTVGLPSNHGRVRTFCQPDYRSHKMDRNIRGSKWPSDQGTRRRDLPAHLNETDCPFSVNRVGPPQRRLVGHRGSRPREGASPRPRPQYHRNGFSPQRNGSFVPCLLFVVCSHMDSHMDRESLKRQLDEAEENVARSIQHVTE